MIGLYPFAGARHLQAEAAPAVRRPERLQVEGGPFRQDARTRGGVQTRRSTKLQVNCLLHGDRFDDSGLQYGIY